MVTLTCALDFEHMTAEQLKAVTPAMLRADSREDAAAKHLEQLYKLGGDDLVDEYIKLHRGS